jgi:hypothetical protein
MLFLRFVGADLKRKSNAPVTSTRSELPLPAFQERDQHLPRSQLLLARCFHTPVREMPAHGSHETTGSSHDKTNEYRFKPSRVVGYRLI